MSRFKVGDVLVGKPDCYIYTDEDSVVKVVKIFKEMDGLIDVEILSHKRLPELVGHVYTVEDENFEKASHE